MSAEKLHRGEEQTRQMEARVEDKESGLVGGDPARRKSNEKIRLEHQEGDRVHQAAENVDRESKGNTKQGDESAQSEQVFE